MYCSQTKPCHFIHSESELPTELRILLRTARVRVSDPDLIEDPIHAEIRERVWVMGNLGKSHNNICRAGIQNESRESGRPRAFLNGQFRLRKAKNCKKTNNFPLCCQLRLRTATEWLSYVSCVILTMGFAVPY